jgi:hypothetical protein
LPLSRQKHEVTFQIKITTADGEIVAGNNSPEGYSYFSTRELEPNDGSEEPLCVVLQGLGNESKTTYKPDTEYIFQVFIDNKLLYTSRFKVF